MSTQSSRNGASAKFGIRLNWHGHIAFGTRWWMLLSRQFGMNLAVQLVIEVVVALILQRGAACCALEAFDVQVLILDAHENASNETFALSANILTSWQATSAWWFRCIDWSSNMPGSS